MDLLQSRQRARPLTAFLWDRLNHHWQEVCQGPMAVFRHCLRMRRILNCSQRLAFCHPLVVSYLLETGRITVPSIDPDVLGVASIVLLAECKAEGTDWYWITGIDVDEVHVNLELDTV